MANGIRRVKKKLGASEIRELLNALGEDSVNVLKEILRDPESGPKMRSDIAKYIITTILDDPGVLKATDNLQRLAELLKDD